ncbi:MAG: CoA ester lyase [SAR202 cluster bacterium]|nr:CoA ester lyase [SAR202 cluster bacterium]
MELLRSLQFIPGNRRDMLEKGRAFAADALIADLEDSVPPAEKTAARDLVKSTVPGLWTQGQKVIVRVNSLDTGLTWEELQAVVGPYLWGISLGKVTSPWHVQECGRMLEALERRAGMEAGKVKIIPWVESARAVLNALAIAEASPRVAALAFGAEDFTNDMGIVRTDEGQEVQQARGFVAMAARAAGIPALDSPYVKFRDPEGLRRESETAAKMGFKGKFSIHPAQIDVINQVFSPKQEDIDYARRVVKAWEESEAQGRGSLSLDGKMVDVPVVKRARNLLTLVEQMEKLKR